MEEKGVAQRSPSATVRQEELASLLIREIKRETEKIGSQFLLVDIPHFSKRDLKAGYPKPLRSLPSIVDGSDSAYADDVVETARLAESLYDVVRLFLRAFFTASHALFIK